MRLWSIHPSVRDRAALVSCWREALLAQAVLAGRTKGYRNHPQLTRFSRCKDPMAVAAAYLAGVRDEALLRGYAFNEALVERQPDLDVRILVTDGQLALELEHLRSKVAVRQPDWLPRLAGGLAHPVFTVVRGPAEEWERAAS